MDLTGRACAGAHRRRQGVIGAAIDPRACARRGRGSLVADRDVAGHRGRGATCRVTCWNPAYADGLPRAATDALGGLDILVNNAGVITRGPVTESSDADWSLSVGVNVEAPFRICRAAIPLMAAAGGGAIVNTASCWGLRPGPNHAVYCMTKAAIASLTQCMGMDHARQGIRINAVCPNEVNTPMLRRGFARRGFDPDQAVAGAGPGQCRSVGSPSQKTSPTSSSSSSRTRPATCAARSSEINGGKPVA